LLVWGLGVELGEFAVLCELDKIGLNPGLDHAMEALNVILRLKTSGGLMIQGVAIFLQINISIISEEGHEDISFEQTLLDLRTLAILHVILKGLAQVNGAICVIVLKVKVLGHCLFNDRNVALAHVTLGLKARQFQLHLPDLS
jgi:hypothetical protein